MNLLEIYNEHKDNLEQEIRYMYTGIQNAGPATSGDFSNRIAHLEKLLSDINSKIAHQVGSEKQISDRNETQIRVVKMFLASSEELKPDREEFEIFVNRENKILLDQGIFLHLILWEDFIDAMSSTRLQAEYNRAIERCDLFVSLFYTKVGQYTREEFDTALTSFHQKDKPLVYTYFKDVQPGVALDNSLTTFKTYLRNLGHFPTSYNSTADLKLHFRMQIEKLLPTLL